jgi:hypothetical protein
MYVPPPHRERKGPSRETRWCSLCRALSPTAVAVVHAKSVLAQLSYWNLIPNSRDASRYPTKWRHCSLLSASTELLYMYYSVRYYILYRLASLLLVSSVAAAPIQSSARASLCMRAFTRTFNKWPAFTIFSFSHEPKSFAFNSIFFFSLFLLFVSIQSQIRDLLFDISKRQKW